MTHVAQDIATTNMQAFIKRDPTQVQVVNRHTVPSVNGGKKWVEEGPVFIEEVRLIPTRSTTEQQSVRTTADGRNVTPGWLLATAPNTEIKVGAILAAGPFKYEVVFQSRVPSWRVTFEAIENGR